MNRNMEGTTINTRIIEVTANPHPEQCVIINHGIMGEGWNGRQWEGGVGNGTGQALQWVASVHPTRLQGGLQYRR